MPAMPLLRCQIAEYSAGPWNATAGLLYARCSSSVQPSSRMDALSSRHEQFALQDSIVLWVPTPTGSAVCGRSYLAFAVATAPGACLAEAIRRTMTCLMPSMRKPTRSMGLNAACTSGLASWRLMTWGCVTL